jgi:hypothetical protein
MFKKFAIFLVAVGLFGLGIVTNNYFIQADKANQAATASKKTAIATRKLEQALLDEFYSLNSKLGVGLSYLQYGIELTQLMSSLNKFEREQGNSIIIPNLKASMTAHIDALTLWKACIENCTKSKQILLGSVLDNSQEVKNRRKLIDLYGIKTQIDIEYEMRSADQSEALTTIWAKAKTEIDIAQNLIKNQAN